MPKQACEALLVSKGGLPLPKIADVTLLSQLRCPCFTGGHHSVVNPNRKQDRCFPGSLLWSSPLFSFLSQLRCSFFMAGHQSVVNTNRKQVRCFPGSLFGERPFGLVLDPIAAN